jgi:hypothetical protein
VVGEKDILSKLPPTLNLLTEGEEKGNSGGIGWGKRLSYSKTEGIIRREGLEVILTQTSD